MKLLNVVAFMIFSYGRSFGQPMPCNCTTEFTLRSPVTDSAISGKVIVEWTVDSAGLYTKPVIIQHLSKPYDDEALRAINEMIRNRNSCVIRCKIKVTEILMKKKIAVNFIASDE